MWENGLIKKLMLASKFMTSQLGKQVIDTLSIISRNKGNHTMKFRQLV